jgi:ABC-type amino acid transport substrate-binding protein
VKVGYFYDGEYMYKTEENTYRGYDVEYLYELARFTGWKYTFVEYETFLDECAALEKGEIDIIPALYYSDERSKKYLFSFFRHGESVQHTCGKKRQYFYFLQ